MIFPYLRGFLSPLLAPVTYFLLALNVFVFIGTMDEFDRADSHLDLLINDNEFLTTQGSAFAIMIQNEPQFFDSTLVALADRAREGDLDSRMTLGSFAMRNSLFMEKAKTYEFHGDDVALAAWRVKFKDLEETQNSHPSFQWGVSTYHNNWRQWITYQFAHGGVMHLFWNMVFLLIFGCFVETQLGSSFVILTYLGGGLAGAYSYSLLSGVSSSPLVGASAAVSGLMGLVAFYWIRREGLNYFYWLLPFRGYYGFKRLPSYLVIIVSLLPDLSGYLASSKEFGSVAYAAHIGGTLWGALTAGALAIGLMEKEVDESESDSDSGSNSSLPPRRKNAA